MKKYSLIIIALGMALFTQADAQQDVRAMAVNGADATPLKFKMLCDAAEKTFSSSCTGKYEGVIGVVPNGPMEDFTPEILQALAALNIVVYNTPDRSKLKAKQQEVGILCILGAKNIEMYPKIIPADPIENVPLFDCDIGNPNWIIERLDIYYTSSGPQIGWIIGTYTGNVGNSAVEGPFREALVQKYGDNNCNARGRSSGFCRSDKTRIDIPERDRPDIPKFHVFLKDDSIEIDAKNFLQNRIKKQTQGAAVNPF